jgi:hypothetical protein
VPCIATPRGFTDTKLPWSDQINNNPCGKAVVTVANGVAVDSHLCCLPHLLMKLGQAAVQAPFTMV